jgi:hypothetical protein
MADYPTAAIEARRVPEEQRAVVEMKGDELEVKAAVDLLVGAQEPAEAQRAEEWRQLRAGVEGQLKTLWQIAAGRLPAGELARLEVAVNGHWVVLPVDTTGRLYIWKYGDVPVLSLNPMGVPKADWGGFGLSPIGEADEIDPALGPDGWVVLVSSDGQWWFDMNAPGGPVRELLGKWDGVEAPVAGEMRIEGGQLMQFNGQTGEFEVVLKPDGTPFSNASIVDVMDEGTGLVASFTVLDGGVPVWVEKSGEKFVAEQGHVKMDGQWWRWDEAGLWVEAEMTSVGRLVSRMNEVYGREAVVVQEGKLMVDGVEFAQIVEDEKLRLQPQVLKVSADDKVSYEAEKEATVITPEAVAYQLIPTYGYTVIHAGSIWDSTQVDVQEVREPLFHVAKTGAGMDAQTELGMDTDLVFTEGRWVRVSFPSTEALLPNGKTPEAPKDCVALPLGVLQAWLGKIGVNDEPNMLGADQTGIGPKGTWFKEFFLRLPLNLKTDGKNLRMSGVIRTVYQAEVMYTFLIPGKLAENGVMFEGVLSFLYHPDWPYMMNSFGGSGELEVAPSKFLADLKRTQYFALSPIGKWVRVPYEGAQVVEYATTIYDKMTPAMKWLFACAEYKWGHDPKHQSLLGGLNVITGARAAYFLPPPETMDVTGLLTPISALDMNRATR